MDIIFSLPAGLLTFWLAQQRYFNAIIASSIIGLVGCLIPDYAHIIYGASFVGMCSHQHFSYKQVAFASLIFPVILLLLLKLKPGLGGTLGFSAFISVSLTFIFVSLFKR